MRSTVQVFLSISELKFQRLRFQIRGFRLEGVAKINFSQKSFFIDLGPDFVRFLVALGAVFLVFCALKTDLKTDDIWCGDGSFCASAIT